MRSSKFIRLAVSAVFAAAVSAPVFADDTEVFFGSSSPPNILVILDTSGSMNFDLSGSWVGSGSTSSRAWNVRNAIAGPSGLLNNALLANANVGLMRYSTNRKSDGTLGGALVSGDNAYYSGRAFQNGGGMVVYPVNPLSTNKANIISELNSWKMAGPTPLAETLYEAYLYLSGGTVKFGDNSVQCSNEPFDYGCADSNITTKLSVAGSRVGGVMSSHTYDSPMDSSCQNNFILFLTDGDGNTEKEAVDLVNTLTGSTAADKCSVSAGATSTAEGAIASNCMRDLAGYMFNNDLRPDVPGTQNVITSFIAYGPDATTGSTSEMGKAAAAGHGTVYSATDNTALQAAVDSFALTVSATSEASFTSPAVAVNAFNKTQVLEDLYIALFKPSQYTHWNGNLKKYKLRGGQVVGRGASQTDASSTSAVDSSGFLDDNSHDFWEKTTDTTFAFTERGGAAQVIPAPGSRKVFTYIGNNMPGSPVNLNQTAYEFKTTNAAITNSILGITGATCSTVPTKMITSVPNATNKDTLATGTPDPCRQYLIDWTRGDKDGKTSTVDVRHIMGAPIHSQPSVVIYGNVGSSQMQQDNDALVFIATNDGILHAFNVSDGTERWSYIPQENLSDLKNIWTNAPATYHYALDGDIKVLKYDADNNGKVDGNDRVFLYMSQGRGGDNYYALDVTDKDNPKFMWSLGQSPSSLGSSSTFGVINKSWSTPALGRVNLSNVTGATQNSQKLVLIFGGGYDDWHEANLGYRTLDSYGNGIYMIDAVNGSLLWSQTKSGSSSSAFSNMTHAIPSIVSVLDTDGDGFSDRMYVGDLAGQLWRFDIYNGATNSSLSPLVTGGVIASLGEKGLASPTAGDIVNNRQFFSAPDIAKVNVPGSANYYAINIGSGDRAHPKSNTTTLDRFYSIRDYNLAAQSQSYYDGLTPIKETDLTVTDGSAAISDTDGWMVVLSTKEKALASSLTFDGKVLFSTYIAVPPTGGTCQAGTGTGRAYTIKLSGERYFSTLYQTFTTTGIPSRETVVSNANLVHTLEGETTPGGPVSNGTGTTCMTGVNILGSCVSVGTKIKTFWTNSGAN